jgi:hypothetical protein
VIVENPLSEETKLGFIRNALERGSQRFTEVLNMCKFNKLNYNDTLKRLHDFEQEYHLNMFSKNNTSRGEKRKHVLETTNNTNENNNNKKNNNNSSSMDCWNCGKKGHKAFECKAPKVCGHCGKTGHSIDQCWSNPDNKNSNNSANSSEKVNKKTHKKDSKPKPNNKKKVNIKDAFNKQLINNNIQEEDSDDEANLMMDLECDDDVKNNNNNSNINEINDLTFRNEKCFNNEENDSFLADKEAKWIIDSGATSHMSPYKYEFINFKKNHSHVKLGDNKVITSIGRGDTKYLKNVMYVPTLKYGLISISKLDKDGYRTHFSNKKVIIYI